MNMARPSYERPTESWTDREIAQWAAERGIDHEEVCAARWAIMLKLMWAVLTGIGLILADIAKEYISHAADILSKAH